MIFADSKIDFDGFEDSRFENIVFADAKIDIC